MSLVQSNSSNYYVFKYTTLNGNLAFPSSGKVYFHKDSVSGGIAYGFRNDHYKMQIRDLVSNLKSENITMEIFGNADCSIETGRIMIGKNNYLFKSKSSQ